VDAADGAADGVIHPPFTPLQAEALTFTAYPTDPLGVSLAAAIEAFLNDASRNTSSITTATAKPLLDRLRLGAGRVDANAPPIDRVASPTVSGDRTVTITGSGF